MAVAGQQHGAARGVGFECCRHDAVARDLATRQAPRRGVAELTAVAGNQGLGLNRFDVGRHVTAKAERGHAAFNGAPRIGARHVHGDQRQLVCEGQGDERTVERPVPATARGVATGAGGDHAVGVGVGLGQRAVDLGLALAVELLHQQRRARAAGQQCTQRASTQLMLAHVVVHFAEQHQGPRANRRVQALLGVCAREWRRAAGGEQRHDGG